MSQRCKNNFKTLNLPVPAKDKSECFDKKSTKEMRASLAKNENIVKAVPECNAAKHSTNKLEVDVESLILKICSHFSRSAKRRLDLQRQFEENELQWEEIIKHVATRFLSLGPAIERAAELLKIDEMNMDCLYEEFQLIKKNLDIAATSSAEKTMSAIEKWKKVLEGFSYNEISNIFRIISFFFSIPSSNCFVERVFSQMVLKWTDVRNNCTPDLIKIELLTTFNYDYDCINFYKYVKSNENLIKLAHTSAKYSKK
ncbi:unnamed protein product [Diatraea saccharalis]|uniref:HAT C-terminal dimerisation domain-containing protein n=1 Tax=Diatraea saccharalis TaxID=40085 RepID=A0A9N9R4Y7_9NEOP|nr:unnamed protein product [Diatraea saccharalis]